MIRSIRQAPLRLFLAAAVAAVAVVGLMTVAELPSATPVHAQEQAVTATRDATGESPPARPTNLQASAEPDSVSLAWTASTDQTVTHYAVLRRDRDDDVAGVFHVIDSNAGSATSYTDRSVSPGDSYVYRVKAVSPTGVSQWSSYARADIPVEADPADLAPSGLSAKAVFDGGVSAGVELGWDAPAQDAASVTGYEIVRAVGDGDLATLAANTGSADTTYADDTATEAGESYAYRVKALRGEEASQPSERAEAIIPKVTVRPVEPPIAEEQNTAIWSATFTPASPGTAVGCSVETGEATENCDATLTDSSFDYDGTTYSVHELFVTSSGTLLFTLSRSPTDATIAELTLNIGESPFPLSSATRPSMFALRWTNTGLSLTAGTPVAVTLTAEAEESAETTVPADWGLIPSGLGVGDRFRLVFLSSTTRDGSSSDIADYNTFVQDLAANGHADIQSHSSTFRVVGSTADVDARDNTATTYTADDKGVAIYWLGGNKVVDDYEDFYDGDWDGEANAKDESGSNRSISGASNRPFTGSHHNGTERLFNNASRALGASSVRVSGDRTTLVPLTTLP